MIGSELATEARNGTNGVTTDTTVFVVDSDEPSREELSRVIRAMRLSVQRFSSAEVFLQAVSPDTPGCVICDMYMSGMSGLELQMVLQQKQRTWPVIFLTSHASTPLVVRAMRQGAVGFMEKPFREDELSLYVREAVAVDRRARAALTRANDLRQRFAQLTDQEQEILEGICRGETNKRIAANLDLSLRTVESRRQQLFRKVGTDKLPDLIKGYHEFLQVSGPDQQDGPRLVWCRSRDYL